MAIDLNSLSPAPWFAKGEGMCCGVYQGTPEKQGHPIDLDDPTWADAQFIALARNAFDVMMRRGWRPVPFFPEKGWDRWTVEGSGAIRINDVPMCWPDPYTALVEADRLYAELIEGRAVAP